MAVGRSEKCPKTSGLVSRPGLQPRDGPHLQIQTGRTASRAHLFCQRPRQVRLSPPLRSRQRQRRFRHRRSRRSLLPHWSHRRTSQEARPPPFRRRHPIQHLPDVRRRRKNPRCLPEQNSAALPALTCLATRLNTVFECHPERSEGSAFLRFSLLPPQILLAKLLFPWYTASCIHLLPLPP